MTVPIDDHHLLGYKSDLDHASRFPIPQQESRVLVLSLDFIVLFKYAP